MAVVRYNSLVRLELAPPFFDRFDGRRQVSNNALCCPSGYFLNAGTGQSRWTPRLLELCDSASVVAAETSVLDVDSGSGCIFEISREPLPPLLEPLGRGLRDNVNSLTAEIWPISASTGSGATTTAVAVTATIVTATVAATTVASATVVAIVGATTTTSESD
jgi:hypothetical protein